MKCDVHGIEKCKSPSCTIWQEKCELKDMTIEELLNKINDGDNQDIHEEIAIRFPRLQADLNQVNARLRSQEEVNENLSCCGNCIMLHKFECAKRTEEQLTRCAAYYYPRENERCDKWTM